MQFKGTLRKVSGGIGANSFGQVVTLVIQVASLPIFLNAWSNAQYGEWLMLSAIPAYFSIADFGIVTAASNQMAIAAARGDRAASAKVFQDALLATGGFILVAGLASSLAVLLIANATQMLSGEKAIALEALIISALINIGSGLFDAIFRSADRYARGVVITNFARLFEWGGTLTGLLLGHSIMSAALGTVLSRTTASLAVAAYLAVRFPQYEWSLRGASWRGIKSLISPGLAFLLLPVGNALSLQGMTILVGTFLGPISVAIFGTYRTLSRCLVQIIAIISKSVWPEMTRAYAVNDKTKLRRLYIVSSIATVLISVGCSLCLWILAPRILEQWTHGKIPYEPLLMMMFLSMTVLTSFWQTGMVVLAATSNHQQFAKAYVVLCGLSLAPVPLVFKQGLLAIAACGIGLELSLIAITRFYTSILFKRSDSNV